MPHHPAFEHLRSHTLDALKLTVEEYRHKATGAQHIHLSANNDENVFLVALRTVPHDSTGVAHILEHTALCGSERYPVRDPFFMMIRRSLNTFMNAFTSSDWTAYPFASRNRKDFDNLLQVYLDAVFFSQLDELDFAQEGHRLEFAQPDNPDSELVYKGVVYNEMKGAMSSVPAQLWQSLCRYLYPCSTYHHNSGGDPEHIPDLSYEQLVSFYRSHYHPSNAIFMTYGDIPAVDHQARFEALALSRFNALDHEIRVNPEKRYHAPLTVEECYPLDDGEDPERKHHVVMGWLLGKSTDLEQSLETQLLISVLLDNSASPLQQALETTDLGLAPSPLCGLDDSQYEMAFACGLEGCRADAAAKVEQLVLDTLARVARDGVPDQQLQAALHQLELEQREVGGDGYPYGLQLAMTALTAATHRGDPIAQLDLDAALTSLRAKIEQPDFIQTRIHRWLLDNPHRVRLTLKPEPRIQERRQAAETQRLAEIRASLSDDDKARILARTQALQERQLRKDDDSILPKVGLADIPADLHYTPGSHEVFNGHPLRCYGAGTNGLVYQQLVCKLPALSEEQHRLLPYYAHCLTELGVGERSYLETQSWQATVVGSIQGFSRVRGATDDVQSTDGYFTLSAKALARNQAAMSELLQQTLENARFDELPRLRELMAQINARRQQSVTGNGHSLAMTAACAGMAPSARLAHQLGGLEGIVSLKALDKTLEQNDALEQLATQLASIHRQIQSAPLQFLLVGEPEHLDEYRAELSSRWNSPAATANFQALTLPPVQTRIREAWLTNTQVNFCAKAYSTVPSEHPDAAPLTVLAGFLRNGYLHRTVREQGGAYGGGASQDSNIAAFRFFSYRDPRLTDTLDDFDRALDWLQSDRHEPQALEEAILGVIGTIDKPASPAGEAKQTFHAELFGRTREKRQRFRQQILDVTLADLQRVTRQYLDPKTASIAVVSHNGNRAQLEARELDLKSL